MKKITIFMFLVFMVLLPMNFLGPSTEKAQSQYIYTCQWSSAVAVGVGISPSIATADRRAYNECVSRSNYLGYYCFRDGCW